MSTTPLTVQKGRTNIFSVNLNQDVSGIGLANMASEIRSKPEQDGVLIATFTIAYPAGGDGTDGEILLSLTDVITGQIVATQGYMDIKYVSGGQDYPFFSKPLEVEFQGSVTA